MGTRATTSLFRVRAVLALGVFFTLGAFSGLGAEEWLTIATYNTQNYTLANRRLADGGYRPEYPKPEEEKAALRRVIAAMDADVIGLQEIGGAGFLNELRRDLKTEGLDYPYGDALFAADKERGLAVLSRRPLGRVVMHADLYAKRRGAEHEESVRRGLLEVEIPTAGGSVTLFVVHLKSRLTEQSDDPGAEDQRVAEAQAARDRVLKIFPEPATARFVIAGDFNDTPGSRALKAFLARGKTDIAAWLDAADERGERWTHVYDRIAVYSRFDHMLVSPGLIGADGDAGAAQVRIVGEPWQTVRQASDHRPLLLRLRVAE